MKTRKAVSSFFSRGQLDAKSLMVRSETTNPKNPFDKMVVYVNEFGVPLFNNWRSHGRQRRSWQHAPGAQGDGSAHAGFVRQAAIEHDRTAEWSQHEARSRAAHRLLRQRHDVRSEEHTSE